MGWLSKLRIFLVSVTAVALICIAVAFSILRAVLPHATGYAEEIEKEISRQIGLPITIGSLDADMSWLTPRLRLVDLTIYRKDGVKQLVNFEEALFALSYFDSIRNMALSVGKISLVGADITVEKKPEGIWLIQGMEIKPDSDTTGSEQLARLLLNTNIALLDSNIHWRDHTGNIEDMDFEGVNISTEYLLGDHSLEIELLLPESIGRALRFIVVLSGNLNNIEETTSRIYIDVTSLNIEAVLSKTGIELAFATTGIIDAQLWFDLDGKNIVQLAGNVSVNSLTLANNNNTVQPWSANEITGEFAWHREESGWRFDMEDFLIDRGGELWAQPARLIITGIPGTSIRIAASYLRPADFYHLPEIFFHTEQLTLLAPVYSSIKAMDIYNMDITVPIDGYSLDLNNVTGSTMIGNLDLEFSDKNILMTGLDGRLEFDRKQARVLFASGDVGLVFGDMFRKPLLVDVIDGKMNISKKQDHYTISADSIRIINSDIGTVSRINAIVPEKGSIVLDLKTDYQNAVVANAYKYYPVSIMSKNLVSWLDRALMGGRVDSGSFLFYGDLDSFPFRNNQGVMQVLFNLKDAELDFMQGWPPVTNLEASVQFMNTSFTVEHAKGITHGNRIHDVNVSIPDMTHPHLTVSGTVDSASEDFQKYVWNSGLNKILGNAMSQFDAEGRALTELTFDMSLEDNNRPVSVDGRIALTGNQFFFKETGYRLSAVSGKLNFTEKSITASDINAIFFDDAVTVDIVTNTEYDYPEIMFNINGDIQIDNLLKRYHRIPEHWLSGSSLWDIDVTIPYGESGYDLFVEMHTDLKGVALQLSDRLSKSRHEVLPLDIIINKTQSGLSVNAASDDAFKVSSDNVGGKWLVNIDSGLIRGDAEFVEDLNSDSTVVLNMDYIDLPSFFRSEHREIGDYNLNPADFPSLDINARTLVWDQLSFTDVVLQTSWNNHGMLIDNIVLNSRSLHITGNGSWLKSWNNLHQSSFNLTVVSEDFGNALANLGFTLGLERGSSYTTINWNWSAEPYRFDIAEVEGVTHVELSEGEITNVKPGAGGRILGLLNVLQLPKRLKLDFGDVTSKGLVFDKITGDFKYSKGIATTDNTYISAASADIKMSGRVGLVARTYDLEVQVQPHSSAATFTGGTIAGGPVVGAGLVLLQKLFGIETISRDEYIITGPWENPVVTQTATREQ